MKIKIFKIKHMCASNIIQRNEKRIFTIRNASYIVSQKGLGRNKLYKLLRALEYIEYKNNTNYAIQQYIDEGYLMNFNKKWKFRSFKGNTSQVYVTNKGLELIKQVVDEYVVI